MLDYGSKIIAETGGNDVRLLVSHDKLSVGMTLGDASARLICSATHLFCGFQRLTCLPYQPLETTEEHKMETEALNT
jgi:hypothetical protein